MIIRRQNCLISNTMKLVDGTNFRGAICAMPYSILPDCIGNLFTYVITIAHYCTCDIFCIQLPVEFLRPT